MRAKQANRWNLSVVVTSALTYALIATGNGCSGPNEQRETVAEILEERSTLLSDLASYDSQVRNEAIRRVKRLGRESGVTLILYLLKDPQLDNYRVEVVLARTLADWKDRRAIPYLLQFGEHPDRGVSSYAADGLLVFGSEREVMGKLNDMLQSEVEEYRERAAKSLSRMHGPRGGEACIEHFEKEESENVRAAVLLPILESDHPERKRVLVHALNDPDRAIREFAWLGLQRYPDLPRVKYDPASPETARVQGRAILELWVAGKIGRR